MCKVYDIKKIMVTEKSIYFLGDVQSGGIINEMSNRIHGFV